jgi:dihydroorotate dehydrogenase (fumarate)
MKLQNTLKHVSFPSCIFNASGPACTTLEELEILEISASGGVTMKSCSPEPREGNPSPRYIEVELGSINSMGLPNHGYKKYLEYAEILKQKYPQKPIIASIVGFCPEDFLLLVDAFQKSPFVDVLEVNLSCPNVVGKPQIAYDFETTDELLKKIFAIFDGEKPIGFKLPPYFDPAHTQMMADILVKYPLDFITCINSVGNTLIIDPETQSPLIKPKGGLGGLGGDYIKPVALANVRMFYKLLGHKVQIIGCGGIKNGVDVFEHLLAWASFVQLGTVFGREGRDCFSRIEQELKDFASKKWYSNITEIIWNLKEL